MEAISEIDAKEKSLSKIGESNMSWQSNLVDRNIFYLDSVDSIDEFKTQVESIFETDDFSSIDARVVTSADEFNSIGGPIVNMKKVGSIMVQGSLLATTLIVSLILILVIRDRRKEIGIYLAMGESSFKVIALQFTEILVITSIAFCLSL